MVRPSSPGREPTESPQGELRFRVGSAPAAAAEADQRRAWLNKPGVRDRGAVLQQELAPYASGTLGSYPDHVQQAVVVVFHTNFTAYEEVRRKQERVVSPLVVVLRPACLPTRADRCRT